MKNNKLTKIFNRFSGKEVSVVETVTHARNGRKVVSYDVADADPTIRQIEKLAKKNGLELSVLLPGWANTDVLIPNRLSVTVDKAADGKWRVYGFHLG